LPASLPSAIPIMGVHTGERRDIHTDGLRTRDRPTQAESSPHVHCHRDTVDHWFACFRTPRSLECPVYRPFIPRAPGPSDLPAAAAAAAGWPRRPRASSTKGRRRPIRGVPATGAAATTPRFQSLLCDGISPAQLHFDGMWGDADESVRVVCIPPPTCGAPVRAPGLPCPRPPS